MEYTKGEWKYNCPYIDTTEGHRIAQVYNYWAPGYSDNAKLLVAAPDMYEALKALLDEYQISQDDTEINVSTNWVRAFNAISKAEGK